MFCYSIFASVLWMVIVTFVKTEGVLEGTWKITGCHLKLQNDIKITEVICPLRDMGCMTDPTSSSGDIMALPGTKIRYKCINSSPEEESTSTNVTTTCNKHTWFPPISRCDEVTTTQKPDSDWSSRTLWTSPIFPSKCGISTIETNGFKPIIWRGKEVKLGEFPWHAGVYDSQGEEGRKPICGATIIASRYLLSAAHCFTETPSTAEMRNPTQFYIMVGKLKSRNNVMEKSQQRHEITHIITNAYRGRDYRYQNDVAVIRTKSEITFNSNVSPICMINDYFPRIPEHTDLWVAGWGYFNSSRIQSENLMSIKLSYISYEECSGDSNSEVSTFLTTEKFCTVRDESMEMSLDEGDSGGGLVTKGPNNAYYLIGIVSLSREHSTVVMGSYVPHFHSWIFRTTSNHYVYRRDKNSPRNGTTSTTPRNTVFCGQPSQTTKTRAIARAYPILLGEFPWNADVYEKFSNNQVIAGATIISSYTLLSAASYFYDRIKNIQRSPVDLKIIVGEITRQTFVADSETTAFYEAESLIFNNVRGSQLGYSEDIVIIVTKTEISFNFRVSPICLFRNTNFNLPSNEVVHALGCDRDRDSLKVVLQPYIRLDECSKNFPPWQLPYLQSDKFCISAPNKHATPIWEYYYGSGLVWKNSVNFAYYLVGIISWKTSGKSPSVVNTDVSPYLCWIHAKVNEIHRVKNTKVSMGK